MEWNRGCGFAKTRLLWWDDWWPWFRFFGTWLALNCMPAAHLCVVVSQGLHPEQTHYPYCICLRSLSVYLCQLKCCCILLNVKDSLQVWSSVLIVFGRFRIRLHFKWKKHILRFSMRSYWVPWTASTDVRLVVGFWGRRNALEGWQMGTVLHTAPSWWAPSPHLAYSPSLSSTSLEVSLCPRG